MLAHIFGTGDILFQGQCHTLGFKAPSCAKKQQDNLYKYTMKRFAKYISNLYVTVIWIFYWYTYWSSLVILEISFKSKCTIYLFVILNHIVSLINILSIRKSYCKLIYRRQALMKGETCIVSNWLMVVQITLCVIQTYWHKSTYMGLPYLLF